MEESEFSVETATGRKIGIFPGQAGIGFVLGFIDGKGGTFPVKYSGRFTGIAFAKQAAIAFAQETFQVAAAHTPNKIKKAQ